MNMAGFDLSQHQTQTQQQILSQRQIQSLEILSLGSDDLREAIYKAAEENPALVVTKDTLTGSRLAPRDYTRVSNRVSAAAKEASDNFAAVLEAQADERESLQEHLLQQFRVLSLPQEELDIGEKLIRNLDDHGFHILAPVSLLDSNTLPHKESLLNHSLKIIQSLDPVGTCTANTEESLLVQALHSDRAPDLALFLLNGHLDFLNPPQEQKVLKKIEAFIKEQNSLFAAKDSPYMPASGTITEDDITEALAFIRTLDPFPARNYGSAHTHFVAPDIYVEKLSEPKDEKNPFSIWNIRLSKDSFPSLDLDPLFKQVADKEKKVAGSVKKAEEFIEALNFRQNTLLRSANSIVRHQEEFFLKGPGHLKPFKQQDLADELGVHETTISRMANSKYIQCEWGLFELKYFFTGAVSRTKEASIKNTFESDASKELSRETVLFRLKQILEEHKDDKKKLSDQKISDIFAQEGIQLARRTVAKYRDMLNIDSSYNR